MWERAAPATGIRFVFIEWVTVQCSISSKNVAHRSTLIWISIRNHLTHYASHIQVRKCHAGCRRTVGNALLPLSAKRKKKKPGEETKNQTRNFSEVFRKQKSDINKPLPYHRSPLQGRLSLGRNHDHDAPANRYATNENESLLQALFVFLRPIRLIHRAKSTMQRGLVPCEEDPRCKLIRPPRVD